MHPQSTQDGPYHLCKFSRNAQSQIPTENLHSLTTQFHFHLSVYKTQLANVQLDVKLLAEVTVLTTHFALARQAPEHARDSQTADLCYRLFTNHEIKQNKHVITQVTITVTTNSLKGSCYCLFEPSWPTQWQLYFTINYLLYMIKINADDDPNCYNYTNDY